jgi:hypothetical protein
LLRHDGKHVLKSEKDSLQIHGDDIVEHLFVRIDEGRDAPFDSGVVEEGVDAAKSLKSGRNVGGDIFGAGDVGVYTKRFATRIPNEIRRLVSGFQIPINHNHWRSTGCESQRNRASDSTTGASYECNLSFKLHPTSFVLIRLRALNAPVPSSSV